MRHQKSGRKLNRNSTHRRALMRNLTISLVEHESITTTVPKAKELRRFVERIITLGKRGLAAKEAGKTAQSVAYHRLAVARMGNNKTCVKKIFDELAPRYKDRPGGYTRVLKLSQRRLGDGGLQAQISLMPATTPEAAAPAPVAVKK
ncbi:MAG: 50S ribosomal protein L17 [Gemmatales bacterium]